MSATTPARIDLTIDELVLHGFPRASRYQIAEALEQELAWLIESRGLPTVIGTGDVPAVAAPVVHLAPAAAPEAIGRQIARALYEGLERCAPG